MRAGFMVLTSVTVPVLLLLQAWKTNSRRYQHWLLTAFVTVYGATIAIYYDPLGEGADGVRHLGLVYDYYQDMSFQQFLVDLWQTSTLQTASDPGIRDPFKHVVSYFVGGVLGAPWLFFTVVAFIYGYFFAGSLVEIFKHVKISRLNYVILGFALLFLVIRNIEGVNTVRTWTGMWILVYACLRYYDTRKLRYALLMFVPPFVHFGFFIMALPAIAVLLLGNHPRAYAILFVASSFTTFFNPGDIVDVISTTERGAEQVQAYLVTEESSFEERRQAAAATGTRWYNQFRFLGIQKWALNILVYTLLGAGVYFSYMNYQQRSIFSIGLLMVTLSNSTWFLFAVSNRSWIIGCVFILAAFLMARLNPRTVEKMRRIDVPYYKWGLNFSLIFFGPYFLFNLSTLLDFPSIFLLMAPFVVWFEPGMNVSIKYVLQILLGLR